MEVELTSTYLIFFAISVVLPMVVALVAKSNAPSNVKAYMLLALSAVNGFGVEAYNSGGFEGFDWRVAAIGALVSFVISAGTHAGLLKPAGVTGSQGTLAQHGR